MLAPNLKPKDTFRLTYDINSIPTNRGSKTKGQPDGTSNEKNFNPCSFRPKIVHPSTTVKLNAKVKTKWLVEAKLYGLPIKTYRLNKLDYLLTTQILNCLSNFSRVVSEDPTHNMAYILFWFPADYSLLHL